MNLIKLEKDNRRNSKNKEVVIFAPVGDKQQFIEFVTRMEKLGINKDKNIDFLFISPPTLKLPENKLSAIYFKENIIKLGTSGAFFAGQLQAYDMNYKFVVMADIDAELDNKKMFYELLELAKKDTRIVSPQGQARTTDPKYHNVVPMCYSVAGFGIYPRKAFELYGFLTPYFFRGAEDYDMNCRVSKETVVYRGGIVWHPMTGYDYYHKHVVQQKMYAYMGALMKCFLLQNRTIPYVAWYTYYSFLADVFDDYQLKYVLKTSNDLNKFWNDLFRVPQLFEIKKVAETGVPQGKLLTILGIFKSLGLFLAGKKYYTYTDSIEYMGNKQNLIIGIIRGICLSPIRFIQGVLNAFSFTNTVQYPVYPNNVRFAEDWMMQHFPRW